MTNTHNAIQEFVQQENQAAESILAFLRDFTVRDDRDMHAAGELLVEIQRRSTKLEAARKKVTDPLNVAKKEIDTLFRPPRDFLLQAKELLKASIAAYANAQQEKYDTAAAAADTNTLVISVPSAPAGTRLAQEIDIEIIDESAIPDEYWVLDWAALKIAGKKGISVPGVCFTTKHKIALTSKK